MKKLLLLLLPLIFFWAPRSASAAYSFKRVITIDHTQVGGTDSTNFPLAVAGTYTDLKTVGNGGSVQNSSGFDIVFTSDAGCTTLMTFENESYSATTGAVAFWVNIPTLSHTADTVFYMCYGNSGISTFQGGATGAVWDSNFKAVWHFPDGSTLSGSDSTSNAVSLTNAGGTAVAGAIDGGASFSGGTGVQMNTANNPYVSTTFSGSGLTLSAWVNPTFVSGIAQIVSLEGAQVIELSVVAGSLRLGFEIDGAGMDIITLTTIPSASSGWTYITATSDAAGNLKTYVNGVADVTGSQSFFDLGTLTRPYSVGGHPTSSGFNYDGVVDEARISNIARSPDWILAEYNNQKPSPTIPVVGPPGGGSPATQIGGFMVGP